MTISGSTNKISYNGDGITLAFNFPFLVFDDDDLLVVFRDLSTLVETVQAKTTDYAVSGVGDPDGGTVTFVAGHQPSSNTKLVIVRQVIPTQDVALPLNNPFPSTSVEMALDKLTALTQQLNEQIMRSILLPITSSLSGLAIPEPSGSKILGWNGSGTALANYTPGADAQSIFSALGQQLCSKTTAAEMATVLGGSVPVVQALAAPGSNQAGLVPQVNSAGSGLQYINPFRKNIIINGAMQISQRGTTFTGVGATAKYSADRFAGVNNSDAAVYCELQAGGPTVAEAGIKLNKVLAIAVTSLDASIAASQHARIMYAVEGYDILGIMGKNITLSFWAMTNRSGGGTFCASFRNGGGDRSYVAEFTLSQNVWKKISVTVPMPDGSAGTWYFNNQVGLSIGFGIACGSTFQTTAGAWQTGNYLGTANQVNMLDANSNALWLTGVQLELGSVATDFEFRSFAEELALCQRYYEKSYDVGVAPGTSSETSGYISYASSGTNGVCPVIFKVSKMMNPAMQSYTSAGVSGKTRDVTAGSDVTANFDQIGFNSARVQQTVTDQHIYSFHWTADAEL